MAVRWLNSDTGYVSAEIVVERASRGGDRRPVKTGRLCPICAPRIGRRASEVGYPPYHKNCICEVEDGRVVN